jgi:hypothetical protein
LPDLEQLQSLAEITEERDPDRTEGDHSHFIHYCICLPVSRLKSLSAGEGQRGGSKFITQTRRKCPFPAYPIAHSFGTVIIYHCNHRPADISCEPELIDPAQRPKQGLAAAESKSGTMNQSGLQGQIQRAGSFAGARCD